MSTGLVSGLPPPPSLGVAPAAKDWSCGWMRAGELARPCRPPSSGGVSRPTVPPKLSPHRSASPPRAWRHALSLGKQASTPRQGTGATQGARSRPATSSDYTALRPNVMEGWGHQGGAGGAVSNFTLKALVWFRWAPSPWTQRWPLSRPHARTECGQGTRPWILPPLQRSGAQSDARGRALPQPTVTP